MFLREIDRLVATYYRPWRAAIGVIFVLAALQSAAVVLRPMPIKGLIEPPDPTGWVGRIEAFLSQHLDRIWVYVVLVVAIEAVILGLRLGQEMRTANLTERIIRAIRGDIVTTLLRSPTLRPAEGGVGAVLSAASGDLESVQRLLREALVATGVSVLQLGLMLVVIRLVEPWLFWILLVEIVVLTAGIAAYAQWRKKRYLIKMKLDAGMLGHLAGLYQKNTDVRFTGLGAVYLGRTLALARRLSHLNLKLWRFHGIYHFLVDFVIGISAALCLVILYATAGAGPLPVGTFLLFMYYTVLIFPNLSQIGEAWPMINDARAALARIEANTGHIRARPARESDREAPALGDIVFEDVSLAGDRGEAILEHVSFTIPAGARFGLCGDSGTGKTTIILATLGLLTPVTGRVTIGGRDAREFTLAERKRLFCYARAQPAFIAGRVDENIALNREAADERMTQALDDTRLAARLAREPAGMRAPIGEKGEPFSGGEQQRIAMARVLMGEQPCLILDEALNSLDEASEVAITERLITGLPGRTLIVVSHRRGLWPMFAHRLELTRGGEPRIVMP